MRIMFLIAALRRGALLAKSLPLVAEVADELWPCCQGFVAEFSLPAGFKPIHFLPGTAPQGDHATLALSQEGTM
jgi:hypothetical protein